MKTNLDGFTHNRELGDSAASPAQSDGQSRISLTRTVACLLIVALLGGVVEAGPVDFGRSAMKSGGSGSSGTSLAFLPHLFPALPTPFAATSSRAYLGFNASALDAPRFVALAAFAYSLPAMREDHPDGSTSRFFILEGAEDVSTAVLAANGRIAVLAIAMPASHGGADEWSMVTVPFFGPPVVERVIPGTCSTAPPKGTPDIRPPRAPYAIDSLARFRAVGTHRPVSVLFAYSPALVSQVGAQELHAKLQVLVDQFNMTAAASRYPWVKIRSGLELVVELPLTGDPASDIETARSSSVIDEARRASGSAFVVVLTETGPSAASAPWTEKQFNPEFGYALVALDAGALAMLVHEVGHLFGMHHDPSTIEPHSTPDFRPSRRGYVDETASFQTIMGQDSHPTKGLYPMIFRFSNPDPEAVYRGRPTGTVDHDNASMLRYGVLRVEQYPSVLP